MRKRLSYALLGIFGLIVSLVILIFWKTLGMLTQTVPVVSSIKVVGPYSWELPLKLNRSFDSILGVLFVLGIFVLIKLRSEHLFYGFSIGLISGFANGLFSGLIYNLGSSLILSLLLGTLVQFVVFGFVFFIVPAFVVVFNGLAYIGGVSFILVIIFGLLAGLPVGLAASLIAVIFSSILGWTTIGIISLIQRS